MKKFLLLFILFFFLFTSNAFVFGQAESPPPTAKPLEVTYWPEIEGFKPETVQTDIAKYVRYIYYFFVVIAGLFAMGALFYGGFRYITSVGNPEALKDAKDQIFAAILGVLILLSSYLILYNINPQLLVLRVPILKPPISTLSSGVWLCKEQATEFRSLWDNIETFKNGEEELKTATEEKQKEIILSLQKLSKEAEDLLKKIDKKCYRVEGVGNIKKDFDNKVTYVYLIPAKENNEFKNYAAILFEEPDFKGKNRISYMKEIYQVPIEGVPNSGENAITKPSSIMPFVIDPKPNPEWKVTTYEEVDYNKGFEEGKKKKQDFQCKDKYWCTGNLTPSPQSIEYNYAKGYITILTKDEKYTSTEVFLTSDSNLLDNKLITNQDCTLKFFRCRTIPAAKVIFLISGYIY